MCTPGSKGCLHRRLRHLPQGNSPLPLAFHYVAFVAICASLRIVVILILPRKRPRDTRSWNVSYDSTMIHLPFFSIVKYWKIKWKEQQVRIKMRNIFIINSNIWLKMEKKMVIWISMRTRLNIFNLMTIILFLFLIRTCCSINCFHCVRQKNGNFFPFWISKGSDQMFERWWIYFHRNLLFLSFNFRVQYFKIEKKKNGNLNFQWKRSNVYKGFLK